MFSRRLEIIQNIQPAYPHQHSSSGRPKHAESQACYDTPFTPAQVAANREERIQRDEARTAQLATQPSAAAASIARVTSTTAGLTASADESHLYIKYYTAAHHTITGSGGRQLPANGRGATADSLARPGMQQTLNALSVQDILMNKVVTPMVSAGGAGQGFMTSSGADIFLT